MKLLVSLLFASSLGIAMGNPMSLREKLSLYDAYRTGTLKANKNHMVFDHNQNSQVNYARSMEEIAEHFDEVIKNTKACDENSNDENSNAYCEILDKLGMGVLSNKQQILTESEQEFLLQQSLLEEFTGEDTEIERKENAHLFLKALKEQNTSLVNTQIAKLKELRPTQDCKTLDGFINGLREKALNYQQFTMHLGAGPG